MSKTLKKESGRLTFDTSLNNLKCFIRAQSNPKMALPKPNPTSTPSNPKIAMEANKKMEF